MMGGVSAVRFLMTFRDFHSQNATIGSGQDVRRTD